MQHHHCCVQASVYSPMRYFGLDVKGTNFGLVGLGRVRSHGCQVCQSFCYEGHCVQHLSSQGEESLRASGCWWVIISKDLDRMKVTRNTPKTKQKLSIISLQFYSRENHSSSAHNRTRLLYWKKLCALTAQAAAKSMDCILDTVAYAHSLDPYLRLLKTNGKLVTVGIPEKPLSFHANDHLW